MRLLKKIIYRFYVIALMIFTVWYGAFMYPLIFGEDIKPEIMSATMDDLDKMDKDQLFTSLLEEEGETVVTDLGYKVISQPFIEGRFHHIGFKIQEDEASVCVRCHGNVTHNESKEVRSFLNMHSFFLACESCHSKPDKDDPPWSFRWADKDDGELVPNPAVFAEIETAYQSGVIELYPIYGNYGAKIAPGRVESGQFQPLHDYDDMVFAERYIGEQEELGDEQKSKAMRIIHRKVSSNPILCENCHADDPSYIPFDLLGYPPSRLHDLRDNAVVGMIKKYGEFYIPNFLTPGKSDP
jgi:hypothetical protein